MEMKEMESVSIKNISIRKVIEYESSLQSDILSVEEPLEIRISYGSENEKTQKNISVTMRTPGNDFDLAIGFLFTEGIITSSQQIKKVYHIQTGCSLEKRNIVQVDLADNFAPQLMQTDRNFYTTSSCGVCGKSSIQSIKTSSIFNSLDHPKLNIATDIFYKLPQKLRAAQSSFDVTGGIHAAGLFTIEGDLVLLKEDVGRHNALDKLIGNAFMNKQLPLNRHILLLSGRASFELIQKAAMAGITVVAAIGAPSSLAVELAAEFNITLLGFLKEDRFNIYNSSDQVIIPTSSKN